VSCCCSPLGPGSGGGLVTSVFGRIGDVVAVLGDYDSSLIVNDSGTVPGATVSQALDALAADIAGTVPVGRTITTTSPLRIDGGASADLSANRTLSVLAVTNTNPGVAVAHAGAGDVGKPLIATATAAQWGGDVVATSYAGGTTPATAGTYRVPFAGSVQFRNTGNTANHDALSVDASFGVMLGGPTGATVNTAISALNTITLLPTGTAGNSIIVLATRMTLAGVPVLNFSGAVSGTFGMATIGSTTVPDLFVKGGGTSSIAGATAGRLLIQGGDCTGASGSRTGGAVAISGGVGATAEGTVSITTAAGVVRLSSNGTGLGLYTATPVAQAARVGQAVDSTTGTASGTRTFVDVTTAAVADPVKINNNFATLVANMWNPLELAIHNLGATA